MQAHMKRQITDDLVEVIVTLPPTPRATEAVKSMRYVLEKIGYEVCQMNENDQEYFDIEDILPSASPGSLLRGLRAKEGMTQETFGRALGIKQHRVSEMERGKCNISVNMAKKIEKIFGVGYKVFV